MKCCICGKEIEGYGSNPIPIREKGECCNECDNNFVTPYRIIELNVAESREGRFENLLRNASKEQLEFGLEVIKTLDREAFKTK